MVQYLIHHLPPLKQDLNYIFVTLFNNYLFIDGISSEISLCFSPIRFSFSPNISHRSTIPEDIYFNLVWYINLCVVPVSKILMIPKVWMFYIAITRNWDIQFCNSQYTLVHLRYCNLAQSQNCITVVFL